MQKKTLFSRAAYIWRKHLGLLLRIQLTGVLMHLLVCTPLLFLTRESTALLALCCIPLYYALIPPLKLNRAELYAALAAGKETQLLHLASGMGYRNKVLLGIVQHILYAVALIPFFICIGIGRDMYYGQTDGFTVLRNLAQTAGGDWLDGLLAALGVVVCSLLPWLAYRILHAWFDHGCALRVRKGFMRGRYLRLLRAWLTSIAAWAPFAAVCAVTLGAYAASLPSSIADIIKGTVAIPSPTPSLLVIAGACVVLLLPLLPFRQVVMSLFIRDEYDTPTVKGATADDAA